MAMIMGVNVSSYNNILKTIHSYPPSPSLFSKSRFSTIGNRASVCKYAHKSKHFTTLNVSRRPNLIRPSWCDEIPDRFSNYDYLEEPSQRWEATGYDNGDYYYYNKEVSNGGACVVSECPMISGYQSEFPSLWDWPERWENNRVRIEHKANSVEIPLSLRMIKKKKQLQTKTGGAVDNNTAQCSVKKAFVSMVYIMGELQNSAMQLKERPYCEDLKDVMSKVQQEMNDSFVWLFRQVLSQTPNLMVYMMLLLANFSLYSMSPDSLMVETSSTTTTTAVAYNNMLQEIDEAKKAQHPASPSESDQLHKDYKTTDMLYQVSLSQDPENPLILTNYARFICLITHDYDRAEELLKRAIEIEPVEAEALCEYADFLWKVRNDTWGAEEMYQQAIAEDPQNPHFTFKYASFLWNSGAEDTCFPLHDNPTS